MSFIQYLQDTKSELKHVSWPTQKQTIIFTILVIAISAAVALLLAFSDLSFTKALDFIISA